MNGPVSDRHADDSSADSLIVHYQVQQKVLNEENAVVAQGSSEQSVQHAMTSSVRDACGSIGLPASAVFNYYWYS